MPRENYSRIVRGYEPREPVPREGVLSMLGGDACLEDSSGGCQKKSLVRKLQNPYREDAR